MEWIELFIVALLPLTALFTVLRTDPYGALISRGVMGAVAVTLYATLGAADVALTEALVGTLLAVVLFAITARSSLVVRLGALETADEAAVEPARAFCERHRLALKTTRFSSDAELRRALSEGVVDVVFAEPDRLSALTRAKPPNPVGERPLVLLAKHGRWHQREMKALYGDERDVLRVSPKDPGVLV